MDGSLEARESQESDEVSVNQEINTEKLSLPQFSYLSGRHRHFSATSIELVGTQLSYL